MAEAISRHCDKYWMNTKTYRMKDSLLTLLAWLYPASLFDKIGYYVTVFRSYKIASKLKACGRGTRFGEVEFLTGHRHICGGYGLSLSSLLDELGSG